MRRYLEPFVLEDLRKKMVFLGGPRQVGKTTLAQGLLRSKRDYLNWDISAHREKILRGEIPAGSLIVFDEIHKYRNWRNFLKGLFDEFKRSKRILVTGSARLDLFRRGGDSLQGRYFFCRLHPLSFAELKMKSHQDLMNLMELGGFPEPFLSGSKFDARRWSLDYRNRLIRDDVNSLEVVQDLGKLELLMIRLPDLVGSPLSLNSLREDLQVSHHTIQRWLDILERLYAFFRIPPFGTPILRAVKKEQKHYHFDWTLVKEPALRFENLISCHLLKWVHFLRDTQGRNMEVRYFRDIDGREVDFVVIEDSKPLKFVECKWGDAEISRGLNYLKARFPEVESWQISATGKKDYVSRNHIRVCPSQDFLSTLI